jgi:hypothetical protein
MGERCKVGQA